MATKTPIRWKRSHVKTLSKNVFNFAKLYFLKSLHFSSGVLQHCLFTAHVRCHRNTIAHQTASGTCHNCCTDTMLILCHFASAQAVKASFPLA